MRIIYVSHTHPDEGAILENVGGMQRVSLQLVQALKQKEGVYLDEHTINVSGRGLIAIKTFFYLVRMLVELPVIARQSKADVILFSSMVTASLAWFIRKRIAIPMVVINHGRDVTLPVRIYQWFVPKIFNSLDGVISVSEATRTECISRGMPPGQGVALPNGFDTGHLSDLPGREQSRSVLQEKFHIPLEKNFMLLTVGRQVKRKGHEWFIRNVLPKLIPNVVYVIIGDGPERESIEEAIGEAKVKDQIYYLGRQPDPVLLQAYAASDLFVMPNIPVKGDMEGFGIVMLEANMAGTPAVAADLEGIRDVISQGNNGYRIPPLEAEAFAEKINNLLLDGLDELSKKTRPYVEERFSWQKVADEYVNYLHEVTSGYVLSKQKNNNYY